MPKLSLAYTPNPTTVDAKTSAAKNLDKLLSVDGSINLKERAGESYQA